MMLVKSDYTTFVRPNSISFPNPHSIYHPESYIHLLPYNPTQRQDCNVIKWSKRIEYVPKWSCLDVDEGKPPISLVFHTYFVTHECFHSSTKSHGALENSSSPS
jgi:hypothetical protein